MEKWLLMSLIIFFDVKIQQSNAQNSISILTSFLELQLVRLLGLIRVKCDVGRWQLGMLMEQLTSLGGGSGGGSTRLFYH